MKLPACLLPLMLAATSAAAQAADVNVQTAWYGQSCGAAHGNVTAHVKSRCDGRPTCQYGVDAGTLGDPAPGCPKNMVVVYACSNQPGVRLSQIIGEANGKTLVLSCVAGQAQQ